MKKNKIKIFFLLFLFSIALVVGTNNAYADWWTRPDTRPTQPNTARPTMAPLPTDSGTQPTQILPTSTQNQPTDAPRIGDSTSAPPNGGTGGPTDDDPCAPGKSFTGPYCGWSPRVGGEEGSTGTTGAGSGQKQTSVRGLSYTSGFELLPSDIILLSGVLCLLLYARSKLNVRRVIG